MNNYLTGQLRPGDEVEHVGVVKQIKSGIYESAILLENSGGESLVVWSNGASWKVKRKSDSCFLKSDNGTDLRIEASRTKTHAAFLHATTVGYGISFHFDLDELDNLIRVLNNIWAEYEDSE